MNRTFRDSYGKKLVDFQWGEIPLDGEGMLTYQDGSEYSGSFKNGSYNGSGKFIWPDGTHYDGQWADDLPHELGSMHLPSDEYKYSGEWRNGTPDGEGVELWSDGSRYTGQWKNGMKDGR